MDQNHQEFIKKAKEEYFKIGSVSCPAFGGEKVYFDEEGLAHLLMKKGRVRKKSDQKRKLYLSKSAPSIIKHALLHSNYTKDTRTFRNGSEISIAEFWEFKEEIYGKIITVLVRKVNDGNKHFFSVKDKKL